MKNHAVLEALADAYEASRSGKEFVSLNFETLLRRANCVEGDARSLAEQALIDAEQLGMVERIPVTHRDPNNIRTIRFFPAKEALLYSTIARESPSQRRALLAEKFSAAAKINVPEEWKSVWEKWCAKPVEIEDEVLALLPKLLACEGEFSLRIASCELCGHSKRLEELAAPLARHLSEITNGKIASLDDLGILPNPRSALLHGPVKLCFDAGIVDLGLLEGAARISLRDIERAREVTTSAARCVTIENETTFQEIAKLGCADLLICTSFPGSATLSLLKRLPATLEFWHFGDSDPAGFEILEDLRARSGLPFEPLHMTRNKIQFEQESLGRPNLRAFPYYAEPLQSA